MCTHGTRFSRQVPINVRAPHTTKPLRSGWEIKSLRMECGTPPSSALRARKAAISYFRKAGHFPPDAPSLVHCWSIDVPQQGNATAGRSYVRSLIPRVHARWTFWQSTPAPSSRVPEASPHAYARDALSVGAGAPAPRQRGGRAGARGPCRKPRGGRARGAGLPAGAPGSRPHPAPAPRAAPLARGNRRPGNGGFPPARPGRTTPRKSGWQETPDVSAHIGPPPLGRSGDRASSQLALDQALDHGRGLPM